MGKNSWLLIHEVSDVVGGNMSMIEDQVEFAKRLQGNLLDILAERSSLSRAQIQRRWKKKDWWLSSEECLEHGFIDRII
jgi:ATP-dependent protease ClpP protease subunit